MDMKRYYINCHIKQKNNLQILIGQHMGQGTYATRHGQQFDVVGGIGEGVALPHQPVAHLFVVWRLDHIAERYLVGNKFNIFAICIYADRQ